MAAGAGLWHRAAARTRPSAASTSCTKGTFVTVLVLALHRDPSVWGPHAEVFDPENFSPEAEAKRPANAWKPFGNGQRACIGRGFAMQEAALALGMILQRFKLIDHRALPAEAEGDADDQARRLQDQGAAAHRSGPRRVCRRHGRRRQLRPAPAAPRAAHAAGPQHAAAGAVRLQPRHRGRTRAPASPTSPRSTASRPSSRRSTTMSASCRARAAC